MTFSEWVTAHNKRVDVILEKLKDSSVDEVFKYFNYDNMVEAEPDFCPLYKDNTKCHNVGSLNCLLCSCPFFKYSDNMPIHFDMGVKVMSVCTINAKDAGTFTNDRIQQCDCSGCLIPHNEHFVKMHLESTLRKRKET